MGPVYWLQQGLNALQLGSIYALIALGYTLVYDYSPSRRYGDRRVALASMFAIIAILVISSYMGTPGFTVVTAPQIEIGHEYMSGEQVGPIRAIPFDEMLVGDWITQDLGAIPDNAPELQTIMADLAQSVAAVPPVQVVNNQEVRYTNMYAELKISDAQMTNGEPSLKELILGIHWDEEPVDPTNGLPGYFVYTYVSAVSNYASGGE